MKKSLLFGIVFSFIGLMIAGGARAQDDRFPITITDAAGQSVTIRSDEAIVSGSGDVTEILVALGFREQLIGIDSSSTYPPELEDELPVVGFGRRLTAEPIIDLAPTVFFCTQTCGPEDVLDQIRSVGIPVVLIPDNETDGLTLPFAKIDMVAKALGVPERGVEVSERLAREISWVQTALANTDEPPSVFHPYVRGRGLQLVAGAGTPAHFMIEGAGGYNSAVDAGVEGYAPLSAEIIFAAFPDYLVLAEGNVEASGGLDNILDEQGLRGTPAVENGNIVVIDTQLLLGMSVRTGESLMLLAHAFHPEMTWEEAVSYPYTYVDGSGAEVTIEEPAPIMATDRILLELSQQLGFHSMLLEEGSSLDAGEPVLVLATRDTDWESWREAGIPVILIDDPQSVDEIAQALHVPGRGEALKAQLADD